MSFRRGAPDAGTDQQELAPPERINAVVLDGLVVLKIIKHCKENFPVSVAGTLLGLDVASPGARQGVMEVTNCFPAILADSDDGADDYQLKMMKAMREVNVDYNTVGWYTTAYMGSIYSKDTVEHTATYQAEIPNAVLLVYDNVPTAQGYLSLKALRLTDQFMEEWRGRDSSGADAFTRLPPSAIFEELPVKVRNSHLVQALLVDLIDSKALLTRPAAPGGSAAGGAGTAAERAAALSSGASAVGSTVGAAASTVAAAEMDTDFARLDLATAPYLEKHLEYLHDLSDQFLSDATAARFMAREREARAADREKWLADRRAENERRAKESLPALPEVDPTLPCFQPVKDKRSGRDALDALLVSAQINSYCGAVAKFADNSFGKLFLAAALQKN